MPHDGQNNGNRFMNNGDIRALLNVIARDIDSIVIPCIDSDSVKFVATTMKTMLARAAHALADTSTGDQPMKVPSVSDWQSLIAWAESVDRGNLAGEETSREGAWNQSGGGAQPGDPSAVARTKFIEPDILTSYLQGRPEYNWVRETTVRQAPGGFSKDPFLVHVAGDSRSERMVLRRDQQLRPLVTSVADEVDVIAALSEDGFPVAAPLWLETSPQYFGASVLASSWLNGSADSTQWSTDPSTVKSVISSAARLLARLHSQPTSKLKTLGSGVPGSVGKTPAQFVAHLRTFWRQSNSPVNPLMERVLDWLDENAPCDSFKPAIVHSDFGFHNLLVTDGNVTGLLDWEFWHVGDPREDLAYTRVFVERVMPFKEFTSIYEAAGGIVSDAQAERFYGVLGGARIAMGCYAFQNALRQQPHLLNSKMIYVGQSFAYRFLIDAAKAAAGELT